jgi:molybdopterin/thiamine biosynthesis adenylyltransferase
MGWSGGTRWSNGTDKVNEQSAADLNRGQSFGAVADLVGCLGAMEVIKLLTGLDQPLLGRLLTCDRRSMSFRTIKTIRRRTGGCR